MQLLIPNNIRKQMKDHMTYAGKREIGGILMGEEIDEQKFRIVDFSVDTQCGTNSNFTRDAPHHDQKLEEFFERTNRNYSRYNYLGEWHSHPSFSVYPSFQDIKAMQGLVNSSEGVRFAVLLIVRLRLFVKFDCSATIFNDHSEEERINVYLEKKVKGSEKNV